MNNNSLKRLLPVLAILLVPVALIIVAVTLSNLPSDSPAESNAVTQDQKGSPLGVWSDLPNFPIVDLGFSGSGTSPVGPLKLKRAAAVAYPPNGKVYVLGGRHRPDGEDIGSRWIWEYDPITNALTQKAALIDANNYGERYDSSMAAAVITDTNGPRIYMIGGISQDSIVTPIVRVYDPTGDTLTTLSPADYWPASPERVPGGYAVYNNKLYIFGGHTAKPTSQLFSDTWVFDPLGTIGNKWTQIAGADLSTARAYIAGATLDGYIYAIGGDIVVSTTVTSVNTVERFNPANPGAGWQPVAPLPYARGDMGAWAYDTGTGYEISGRILVAGGGYPSPDTHSYIYNPVTNSWGFFADMLRPRRNYAYTQLNGILYAWGGYNVTRGVQDGSNDSMKYDASGPPPPPVITPTNTPIPSPTSCYSDQDYEYLMTGAATVVPGTTMVPGSNCSTCIHLIDLPFPVQLYGQTFNSAMVGSTGNMQLQSNSPFWINRCLPYNNFTYTLMPLWDDLVLTGGGSGIFTSVSGSAPDRIFNVEWRGTNLDFEIRLYEDSPNIEFIYGTLTSSGSATIGIQKDMTHFTQVSCNTVGISSGTKITFSLPACGTPTPTVTGTPPTATLTPTITQTPTRTQTPTITPTVCNGNYGYLIGTGATLVPGTSFVAGSNCDDCSAPVDLPFFAHFYDQNFNSVNVISNGSLQFTGSNTAFTNACIPVTGFTYTLFAYWDDLLLTTSGDGVYTSVSGSAPNRIFNIEWRGCYYSGGICGGRIDFEVRLYEFDQRIDVIFGTVENGNGSATGGVQKDQTFYTQVFCDGSGPPIVPGTIITYTMATCGTATPGASPTNTSINTPTNMPTNTNTPVSTNTNTPVPPTSTAVSTNTNTAVPSTSTSTALPTDTSTAEPTNTEPVSTDTPQPEPTDTAPPVSTNTSVPAPTDTSLPVPTDTSLPVPTDTTVAIPTETPTVCTINFTDVSPGSTFYDYITCMACRGIINGYTSGCESGNPCFRPDNNVTRGQLAKIVSNSAGFNEDPGPQRFEDVPLGSTFYDFIGILASRNIIAGYPCGGPGEPCVGPGNLPYFRPNANITRGQASKIVSEAAGYTDPAGDQQFQDVLPGSTFYNWIWRLTDRGIMNGYACGSPGEPCAGPANLPYFRPGANATRGQASKIVANTFLPDCFASAR